MEEGKVEWSKATKIDRIRHAHVQRIPSQNLGSGNKSKSEIKTTDSRFYQRGMCLKYRDHETGGVFYKHICATCFTMGQEHRYISKSVIKLAKKTSRALPKRQCIKV